MIQFTTKFLAMTALSSTAYAAPLAAPYALDSIHTVHMEGNLDPALLVGGGFGHSVTLGNTQRSRQLSLEYALRTVPTLSSGETSASGGMRLLERPGLDLLGSATLEVKALSNRIHAGMSTNARLSFLPGYFGEHWHVAAEGSVQATAASGLWHTEAYKEIFPDVYNGFVGPGAPFLYAGGVVGAHIGPVMTDLRFVWRSAANLKDLRPYYLPYTATLRVGHAW